MGVIVEACLAVVVFGLIRPRTVVGDVRAERAVSVKVEKARTFCMSQVEGSILSKCRTAISKPTTSNRPG